MKKLSSSLFDGLLAQLRAEGIAVVRRIGVQGQLLWPSRRPPDFPSAATLRYALQESIGEGGVYLHPAGEGCLQWVFALEHMHVVHGGLCGALRPAGDIDRDRIRQEGETVFARFYAVSGWKPVLLQTRRQDRLRRRQLEEAARQRMQSTTGTTAFDQERMLLAAIRAGDRNGARRILNEMLATIYLSAPQPVVLRARVIELVSALTRAAVEDNPLLEDLIEQSLQWTEKMVRADSFEALSTILMQALDAFIDAVHLHASNRTNVHVHKALTYISRHYQDALSLQQVAQHAGLSAYRLAHLFREHTGKTVVETIRQVRLQQAEVLLRQTGMTCAEVGYAVGFADQSYFILHFKRHAGMTPGHYRRARTF